MSADSVRVAYPLFQAGGGGSSPTSALHARDLIFEPCDKLFAVRLVEEWHSRLPVCQRGPWQFAFHAYHMDVTYAVALWNNPSTCSLPANWLELRRLACSEDSPKNTCSRFLGWMTRYFSKHHSDREKCISYQDTSVHSGVIYRAAGWKIEGNGQERERNREKGLRTRNGKPYRTNLNGKEADRARKIRWARDI